MQQHQNIPASKHASSSSSENENEVVGYDMSDVPYGEVINDDVGAAAHAVTYRKKHTHTANTLRRHSTVIPDTTPRQSMAVDNRRYSYSVPDSKRESVASDATITSPKSSDFGRGMHRSLSLCKLC